MKPLLCFDVDETLIYSNKVHIKSFNKAFVKNELKPINEKILEKALQGEPTEVIIKKFYNLSKEKLKKVHFDKRRFVVKETYKYARQIKNSSKVLKYLKEKYRIALLSNCTHNEILVLLKGAKISVSLFDKIIGANDVKHAKPYPDEIFKAEKLFHEKAQYMIGDSLQDIRAAKKAKVKIISVLTGNTPKSEITKYNPNYIIKDISKLKRIL